MMPTKVTKLLEKVTEGIIASGKSAITAANILRCFLLKKKEASGNIPPTDMVPTNDLASVEQLTSYLI